MSAFWRGREAAKAGKPFPEGESPCFRDGYISYRRLGKIGSSFGARSVVPVDSGPFESPESAYKRLSGR